MTSRRETRGLNWRVREAIGIRPRQAQRVDPNLAELLMRADPRDMDRIVELLNSTIETTKTADNPNLRNIQS